MPDAVERAQTRSERVMRWVCVGTVSAFFLVAATGKAMAPGMFEATVAHVLGGFGLPRGLASIAAPGIVATEAAMGVGYFALAHARVVRAGMFLTLAALTAVLAWMAADPPARGCSCVGFWSEPSDPRREILLGLVRNAGLMTCVLAVPVPRRPDAASGRTVGARMPRGLTLIEVLVVMAVLAVVLAIALPMLARARGAGREAVYQSDTRQILAALAVYAGEQREAFPFCATPGDLTGAIVIRGEVIRPTASYFHWQSLLYVNLLDADAMASMRSIWAGPADEEGLPEGVRRTLVRLGYGAFSRARYWEGAEPPNPAQAPPMLVGGRWSEVQHPSEKGLLLHLRPMSDAQEAHRSRGATVQVFPWVVGWADGRVTRRDVDLSLRYDTVSRPATMFEWPVLSTEGGLGGRDFEIMPQDESP